MYVFDVILYPINNPNVIKNSAHNCKTRSKTSGLATINFCRLSKSINSHYIISLKKYNKLCQFNN